MFYNLGCTKGRSINLLPNHGQIPILCLRKLFGDEAIPLEDTFNLVHEVCYFFPMILLLLILSVIFVVHILLMWLSTMSWGRLLPSGTWLSVGDTYEEWEKYTTMEDLYPTRTEFCFHKLPGEM
jgi:hypothetical protein